MLNDNLKNYLHLHFIVFIWGFTAVIGALISLDATPLVWYRMLMAVGFIGIYLWIKKIDWKVPRKTLIGFIIGGVIIALHWVTFFKAIKVSNVSVTLAMMSTGSFFTAILEPIWYKRKVIWYEIFFGLIVVGGLYIIFEVETEYVLGIVLALTAALLSAIFTLINGKFIQSYKPSVISFYELFSGVVFLSFYLWFTGGYGTDFFKVSVSDWVYLGLLASVCTAYAFIASVKVMKFISPYTVMLTINMEPVYGIILAYLVFGAEEKMSSQFYVGATIILLTVIVNGVLKNKRKRKSTMF
ncbi:Permease of the drug/metabolite transporter (DMT) superfamily [Zhouia amylolytica]|uniref:Permease of the drug/metabolite transporter (DMT) superfamily n=1 Tax=Zhouia amylolytica TaxID=376730 RepID=A0A1I6RU79_9FLAO|nr:DMT family transporter [Zhouia amylolytica]SFS68254.1 Permease of the drug/metabolite transporter (DMT) superfamily [Zhouia amylolytica]